MAKGKRGKGKKPAVAAKTAAKFAKNAAGKC